MFTFSVNKTVIIRLLRVPEGPATYLAIEKRSQGPPWTRLQLGALCCSRLTALLLHKLPHSGDMTGRAALGPGFEPLGGSFQIREEVLISKPLTKLGNDRFE